MAFSRRRFVRESGVGLLTFQLAGCGVDMTPQQAHEADVTLQIFSPEQARAMGALGDTVLPGSTNNGLVEFVDHQLAAAPAEQMLMIKYVGPPPPYEGFYQAGLAALDQAAQAVAGQVFADLPADRQTALVGAMAEGELEHWDGPPAPFFYFVVRNDAVDVCYGTKAGMEALGVPYMAHIEPPSPWGQT